MLAKWNFYFFVDAQYPMYLQESLIDQLWVKEDNAAAGDINQSIVTHYLWFYFFKMAMLSASFHSKINLA